MRLSTTLVVTPGSDDSAMASRASKVDLETSTNGPLTAVSIVERVDSSTDPYCLTQLTNADVSKSISGGV